MAITATVLSVVEAYPEKLFGISCILIRTKEICYYDTCRGAAEIRAGLMSGFLPRDKVFEEERVTSNNFEFRKITFEQVIMDYQIKKRRFVKRRI